ncbi:MAG: hypothetical protein ABJY83_19280 [Roseibium sp.]
MTKRNDYLALLGVFMMSVSVSIANAQPVDVHVPKPHGANDVRFNYGEKLLALALDKAGVDAKIVRVEVEQSRDRRLSDLKSGKNLHVSVEVPKPGWEEQLLPVRIPIRKGIQGYRLFLINSQDQDALSKVNSLKDLQQISTGSGTQWSVTPLLQNAGFDVVTTPGYMDLFEMLKLRRFITFSRGINEIFDEQETFSKENANLVVENTLSLYMPLPTYFFVSPKYPELAKSIESGLKIMIADGSLDTHFDEYIGEDAKRAALATRKVFSIPNHNLSKETPLDQKEYWFDPQKYAEENNDNDS